MVQLSELLKTIKQDSATEMYAEVKNGVYEGDINSIQMLVGIKILAEMLDSLRTTLMPNAIDELQNFGTKEVPMFGALLSIKDAGVTWDFKVCEDNEWEARKAEEAVIAAQRKLREAILKKFYENPFIQEFVDEETGEVTERANLASAPVRKSTTIVQIEFPKPKKEKKEK